jgi:hypothetical protein
MQPNALLIWQNFIICKKWVLHIHISWADARREAADTAHVSPVLWWCTSFRLSGVDRGDWPPSPRRGEPALLTSNKKSNRRRADHSLESLWHSTMLTPVKGWVSTFMANCPKINRPNSIAVWICRRSSLESLVLWVNKWCHLQYGLPCNSCAVGNLWPSSNFNCFSLNNRSKICLSHPSSRK